MAKYIIIFSIEKYWLSIDNQLANLTIISR